MKSFVLSGMFIFLAQTSIFAITGDASNESLAEAWGVTDPAEIEEIKHSQDEHHNHSHHRHP